MKTSTSKDYCKRENQHKDWIFTNKHKEIMNEKVTTSKVKKKST
jgi:hypothetical protein